jgi:hypothetical protein
VDVTVTQREGAGLWQLTDLLGRSMGHIQREAPGKFIVTPEGQALETMEGMNLGPFVTLDDALSEIETHTRGVCRLDSGQDRS